MPHPKNEPIHKNELIPVEEAALATFSARDLIDETAQEEGTFEIPLKTGRKILVRRITSYQGLVALRKRAALIMQAARKGTLPEEWKKYLPITEQVADIVADMTGLMVSPTFTDLEVLELCARSGVTAVYLHGLIRQNWNEAIPAAESQEIEELKNA